MQMDEKSNNKKGKLSYENGDKSRTKTFLYVSIMQHESVKVYKRLAIFCLLRLNNII